MKLFDKLWAVVSTPEAGEDKEDDLLAYMSQMEYKSDGSLMQSSITKQKTGRRWASSHRKEIKTELYFDNVPTLGFEIVGSVSRWSTSNKLFRVKDPRGFIVEIPTGNLALLLKHTIVDHAKVLEPCVWGRDGSNHILIPTTSQLYKDAIKSTEEFDNRVKVSTLEVGDVVTWKSWNDNDEFVFLGRGKAIWQATIMQAKRYVPSHRWLSSSWKISRDDKQSENHETLLFEDEKYAFVFKNLRNDNIEYIVSSSKPVTKLDRRLDNVKIDFQNLFIDIPKRVDRMIEKYPLCSSWMRYKCNHEGLYCRVEAVGIKWKEN